MNMMTRSDSECSGDSNNDALCGQPIQNFLSTRKKLRPFLSTCAPNNVDPHITNTPYQESGRK